MPYCWSKSAYFWFLNPIWYPDFFNLKIPIYCVFLSFTDRLVVENFDKPVQNLNMKRKISFESASKIISLIDQELFELKHF